LLYFIGRSLQFAALVILPLAMLSELQHQLTLGQMLTMTMFGLFLFYVGYVLQGLGGSRS
jgi:hypothetical protein